MSIIAILGKLCFQIKVRLLAVWHVWVVLHGHITHHLQIYAVTHAEPSVLWWPQHLTH